MKGKFIVGEGEDGAGKTTSIKYALKLFEREGTKISYNKGLKTNTFFGKLTKIFPVTLLFLIEQLYMDLFFIKPKLKKGQTIIQDRWYYTVFSHNKDNLIEKILRRIFIPILSKPDFFIFFTVSLKERIKRLKKEKGHEDLVKNSYIILKREKRQLSFFNNFKWKKVKIDTTGKTEKESGCKLYNLISFS